MQGRYTILGLVLVAGLAGCATTASESGPQDPEAAERSLALADSQSAFGYESPDWGTPFWERLSEKVDRARASSAEAPATTDDTLNPTPHSEPMTPSQGTPAIAAAAATGTAAATEPATDAEGLAPSVALAWQGDGAVPAALADLSQRLQAAGMIVVGPNALADAISDAPGCNELTRPDCLASIARYPAPRLLLVAEPAGDALSVVTYDTQFGARYSAARMDRQAPPSRALDALVAAERRRLNIAPWFTRSFAERDGQYYLAAGQAQGLGIGDRLAVHESGKLVRGPAGQPVVWEPGARSATLVIEQVLGANTSVARLESGTRVSPEALLTVLDGR